MSAERPTVREALLARPLAERRRVEDAFFRRLRLPGGVTKRTERGRLADLDALLMPLLPATGELALHDVAVSSGVTTLDWLGRVQGAGRAARMVAGDLLIEAFLLSAGRRLEVLVDRRGRVLQFDALGRALPGRAPWPLGLLPWLGRLAVGALLAADRELARALAEGREVRGRRPLRSQRVPLVVPELAAHPDIELIEDDLLGAPRPELAGRFDAVRAANLLNLGYFPPETLGRMVAALALRLKPGGLLAVVRSEPGEINHGTIFRLAPGGRLEVAARLGRGSEIEELARR